MKNTLTIAAVVALAGAASAQLVVESDLGTLPIGVTNIMGDTATGANNASGYAGFTNPALTWTNELVYQFDLASSALLTLDFLSDVPDTDTFILDGLSVTGGMADNALASLFLDGGAESIFLGAGTYYVSVDTFGGAGATPTSSVFDLNIDVATVSAPNADFALGAVATDQDVFSVDLAGSDFDTEIGIFDSDGFLLASNDDARGLTSEILGLQLPAGEYYMAIGEFNTTYGDGFQANPGDAAGTYAGQINGTQFSGDLGAGEIVWGTFNVTPAPGAAALLGLAGIAGLRRRRA